MAFSFISITLYVTSGILTAQLIIIIIVLLWLVLFSPKSFIFCVRLLNFNAVLDMLGIQFCLTQNKNLCGNKKCVFQPPKLDRFTSQLRNLQKWFWFWQNRTETTYLFGIICIIQIICSSSSQKSTLSHSAWEWKQQTRCNYCSNRNGKTQNMVYLKVIMTFICHIRN